MAPNCFNERILINKINLLFLTLLLHLSSLQAQRQIWGTVATGGENGYGYIYKCNATGDDLTVIHYFQGTDGYSPGALLLASNNKLYGVTTSGGNAGTNVEATYQGGVLFEVDLLTETFTVLKHFTVDNTEISGVKPMGTGQLSLTEVNPGVIYGNLAMSLSDKVFSYNIEENSITSAVVIPTFNGGMMNNAQGMRLTGALYLADDGYLYGSTYERSECPVGMPIGGTVLRIDPATNGVTFPHIAPCQSSEQGLLYKSNYIAVDEELYSVTYEGGEFNMGVIYSFNPVTDTYTKKFDFDGTVNGNQANTLLKGSNGKLYGTTIGGGLLTENSPAGCGILYEFNPETNSFSKLYDFLYENGWYMAIGTNPQGTLIEGSNEKLYGVTPNGVFEYDLATNQATAKGRFPVGYLNGYPSLTSVCEGPFYQQEENNLQACVGEAFTFDINCPNAQSVVWYHNELIDLSQTGTLLTFDSVTSDNAGEWKALLSNECGSLETHVITVTTISKPIVTQDGANLTTETIAQAYQWIDCESNTDIEGATEAVYAPETSGSYAISTDTGTCVTTSDCFEYVTMGVDFLNLESVAIYPNPASSEIFIAMPEEATGFITNFLGQILIPVQAGNNIVSALPSGTYMLVLTMGESTVVKKIIKI